MRVLVTGATGFTGSRVVPFLLAQGSTVRCIARRTSNRSALLEHDIEWRLGDLNDEQALEVAFADIDCLVHVASLGFDYVPKVIKTAERFRVKRAIFVSSTAIFTSVDAPSKHLRQAGERQVADSNLNYTLLRPTMIYGSVRDRNMSRLIRFLNRYPIIPIFGPGTYLQQPVHVDDVASAIVTCAMKSEMPRLAYNIAGEKALTYLQIIETICILLKKSITKVHLPLQTVVNILQFIEKHGVRMPIKAEQLLRLNEHKNFDYSEAVQDFGYCPRTFEDGIAAELRQLGVIKT